MNIIYGVGQYGKLCLEILNFMEVKVDYFCQTTNPIETNVNGIPVVKFDELDIDCDDVIYIAIQNEQAAKTVFHKIHDKYDENIKIVFANSFIDSNSNIIKKEKYCLSCDQFVNEFRTHGINENIFKIHKIIGGGYRENCLCPLCFSYDRERWLMYLFRHYIQINDGDRVLHFAPETGVKDYFKRQNCDYYPCDIDSQRAAIVVDVTEIPFKDESFDLIIINHVLEHIQDEAKAISELKRVLKPNGKIVISFPICMDQETYEDISITSPQERLLKYGQEDHVRLYGSDYMEQLEKYNLSVCEYRPNKVLNEEEIVKYGLIADDIVMVCKKGET